jgi:hypothetical protein
LIFLISRCCSGFKRVDMASDFGRVGRFDGGCRWGRTQGSETAVLVLFLNYAVLETKLPTNYYHFRRLNAFYTDNICSLSLQNFITLHYVLEIIAQIVQ